MEGLDGDEVRQSLSPDLGFSAEERQQVNLPGIQVSQYLLRHGFTFLGTPMSLSGNTEKMSSSFVSAKNAKRKNELQTCLT